MKLMQKALSISIVAFAALAGVPTYAAAPKEDYVQAPMPPGFQVIVSEVEGPVFANAEGRSLYMWPKRARRSGLQVGDEVGVSSCGNEVVRETSGGASPYAAGFELPGNDTRPACTQVWPPVYAAADAKPVGRWSVIKRTDGRMQWAYDRRALYTSVLDKQPGDVFGGTNLPSQGEGGGERKPVGPKSNVPAQFAVHTTMTGRFVTVRSGHSIYTYDGDSRNKSNCKDACLDEWSPVLAAASSSSVGEWTIFERAPGIHQWAFRGRPVYLRMTDLEEGERVNADVPGWHNVFTQMVPAPPKDFAMKATLVGTGLGDSKGMTVYRYICVEDGIDNLGCDTPNDQQIYRFAMCGGGDPDLCVKTFPYVIAPVGAKTGNHVWGTMYIDPKTGKRTEDKAPGALNVWTFRDRPVYTFAGYRGYGDSNPSELKAHGWGEGNAGYNGYMAMIYRDGTGDKRDGSIGGYR